MVAPTTADRVRVAVSGTPGTGTITLGAAQSAFRTLAAAGVATGSTVRYMIEDGSAWEVGTGVYDSTAGTLTRALTWSSTGALLVLTSAAIVSLTLSAADIPVRDALGIVPDLIPGLYNYSPAKLMKWRAKRGAVKVGASNALILHIGDSTTYGYGSQGLNVNTNLKALSYPTQLAAALTAAGLPAVANGFLGDGNPPGTVYQAEPRIAATGSWSAVTSAFTTLTSIGRMGWSGNTTTGALSFTPGTSVDTFIAYYLQGTGTGTITLDINGGTTTSVNTSGASAGFASATKTGSLSTSNVLNVKWASGAAEAYIQGFDAYNSASKVVRNINAGWCSGSSVEFANTSQAWSEANAIAAIAPDLTAFNVGINDWRLGTALGTFKTNMQTDITKAQLSGDAVLIAPVQSDPAVHSAALQASYIQALKDLAQANNLVLLDMYTRTQYTAAQAAGLMIADSYHYSAAGYYDFAQAFANLLLL